jgi:hypothetical protein
MFSALAENHFLYDCSMPSRAFGYLNLGTKLYQPLQHYRQKNSGLGCEKFTLQLLHASRFNGYYHQVTWLYQTLRKAKFRE